MADFDIRDIAALKVKLQIIEKLVLADWILIILSMYYDWGGWITCLIVIQIILYIYKSKLRKQLKQKEYLAKVVEERTIELRIQRDQVLNESKKLSDALDALAKAQDELVRKEKLATVGQLTQGLVDRILNPINYINNFAGLSANLIKDLKENITDQQAIMSKENYADSIEISRYDQQQLAEDKRTRLQHCPDRQSNGRIVKRPSRRRHSNGHLQPLQSERRRDPQAVQRRH